MVKKTPTLGSNQNLGKPLLHICPATVMVYLINAAMGCPADSAIRITLGESWELDISARITGTRWWIGGLLPANEKMLVCGGWWTVTTPTGMYSGGWWWSNHPSGYFIWHGLSVRQFILGLVTWYGAEVRDCRYHAVALRLSISPPWYQFSCVNGSSFWDWIVCWNTLLDFCVAIYSCILCSWLVSISLHSHTTHEAINGIVLVRSFMPCFCS